MSASPSWLERLDRLWYPPAPAARLAMLRILVGGFAVAYLLVRFPAFLIGIHLPAAHFAPVGPVSLLQAPLPDPALYAQLLLALASGAAFTLGWFYRLSGPLFAALLLWVTSYRSSWGMTFHTENLLALHTLLLAAAPAADALALDSRGHPEPAAHGRYGWAIRAQCVITVLTYVLAGIAKLRISGSEWISGDVLRVQVAYDNLRKLELGSGHSPIGAWLVGKAWVFPPLALLTMVLELGAPLALLGKRVAGAWVVGVYLFHWGVLALMAIAFPYPLAGVAYASFFEVEKLQRLRHSRLLSRKTWR